LTIELEQMEKEIGPVEIPIDGCIDLHTFLPQDAADVVEEYIRACREKGIFEVRVIHGKGKGTLRRTVHAVLDRHPMVAAYHLDPGPSGWGATIAHLR